MPVLSNQLTVDVPVSGGGVVLSNQLTVDVPVSGVGVVLSNQLTVAVPAAGVVIDPPTGVATSAPTETSLTVSWTDTSGGTAWHRAYFRVNGTEDAYEIGAEVPPGTVSALVAGLTASTTYQVAATAFIESDESVFSTTTTGTTSGPPPPPPTPPSIDQTTLPSETVGVAYSQTLTASSGTPPYTWSVFSGSLPTSLSLNASTGAISGTPTVAGEYAFTIRVTDAEPLTDDQAFTITIDPEPLPPPPDVPTGFTLGTATQTTIPFTWTTPVSGDIDLQVDIKVDNDVDWTIAWTGLSNTVQPQAATELTPGVTYNLRAIAIEGAQQSDPTGTVTTTTAAPDPPPDPGEVTGARTLRITISIGV